MRGTFENGQPKINISVKGSGAPKIIEAIVDSGFNGYLKIPYEVAFPLGLTLVAVGSGTVADGNMSANLVCEGEVCIEESCVKTSIDVHPAKINLIGTSLLRDLKKSFLLDASKERVEVTDSPASPQIGFSSVASVRPTQAPEN